VLWASEAQIYGRFGYGLGSEACSVAIERDRAAFQGPPGPECRARLVGEAESLDVFPAIWDRLRTITPGMLSRSQAWWRIRRVSDVDPRQQGGGPLQRVVIDVEGQPEAYALYRLNHRWDATSIPVGALQVVEAIGATPRGTRLVWRYLLDIDLMQRIEASGLPLDHPLALLITEPRRLHLTLIDALWVRIVDIEAALAARAYGSTGAITFEVEDGFCPWNAGRFRLDGGARRVVRTTEQPDLRLDIAALGSAYLGGISFRRLADAGRVQAREEEDAVDRADRLFRATRAPWCPEIF
jgi:predicted acetyltransferase